MQEESSSCTKTSSIEILDWNQCQCPSSSTAMASIRRHSPHLHPADAELILQLAEGGQKDVMIQIVVERFDGYQTEKCYPLIPSSPHNQEGQRVIQKMWVYRCVLKAGDQGLTACCSNLWWGNEIPKSWWHLVTMFRILSLEGSLWNLLSVFHSFLDMFSSKAMNSPKESPVLFPHDLMVGL